MAKLSIKAHHFDADVAFFLTPVWSEGVLVSSAHDGILRLAAPLPRALGLLRGQCRAVFVVTCISSSFLPSASSVGLLRCLCLLCCRFRRLLLPAILIAAAVSLHIGAAEVLGMNE